MFSYQPFGRAGGGAPLKDQAGNVYSMLSIIDQKIIKIQMINNVSRFSESVNIMQP